LADTALRNLEHILQIFCSASQHTYIEVEYKLLVYNTLYICPLSWSVQHNFVRDDIMKGCGRGLPHPHQTGLIFPSFWDVRQKVAIATLSVL
jgi:hypothetical protein